MPSTSSDPKGTNHDTNAERHFDSIGIGASNTVQQADHQLMQSNQSSGCDQKDNNKENTTDELPTSSTTPIQSRKIFDVDPQSLDGYDDVYISELDGLSVNSILAIQQSKPSNITCRVFENYAVSPSLPAVNVLSSFNNLNLATNASSTDDCTTASERKNRSSKIMGSDGKPQYACNVPDCGKTFTHTGTLSRHAKSHLNLKNFICQHCKRGFARNDHLNQHVAKVHTEIKISSPDKSTKRKYTKCECPNCSADGGNKTKGPDGKSLHVCYICNKVYSSAGHLNRHLDTHSSKKNFTCQHCDKGFVQEDEFLAHVQMHADAGDKKRAKCKCPNCSVEGGNTTRDSDGKLKHVCHIPGCDRVFGIPANLRKHIVRHGNKKGQASGGDDDVAEDQQASKGSN